MHQTRVTGLSRLTFAAFSLLIAAAMSGCKAESNTFTAANASVGSGGGTVDANTGFGIRLKTKTGIDAFIHKFGNVNTACEVPPSALDTPTEINCMLNMMEYDMWYYGYEYEVTVPENRCKFLAESPHRYFSYEPGAGPSSVVIETLDGNLTSCIIDGATIAGASCATAEATFDTESGQPTNCIYNYSKASGSLAGPNCCDGTVAVSVTHKYSPATPPATSRPTESRTFDATYSGGSAMKCVSSAYNDVAGWKKDADGNAADLITALNESGYVRSVKVPGQSIKSVLYPSTFSNAGFYGWNDYAADPENWAPTKPRAFGDFNDRGQSGGRTGAGATAIPLIGDGSMTVQCLNAAGESLHKIHMYANEWNTVEDYMAFKKDGDANAVNPNRVGVAGVDCSALNTAGTSCNSIWGFDDLTIAAGSPSAYVFPMENRRAAP